MNLSGSIAWKTTMTLTCRRCLRTKEEVLEDSSAATTSSRRVSWPSCVSSARSTKVLGIPELKRRPQRVRKRVRALARLLVPTSRTTQARINISWRASVVKRRTMRARPLPTATKPCAGSCVHLSSKLALCSMARRRAPRMQTSKNCVAGRKKARRIKMSYPV